MTDTLDLDTQLGPMRVYAQGTITRALQDGQWWDDHLKPVIDSAQFGGAVDIGAHFGWFTCYLAGRHPHVYACEPWPPSFQLLQYNVRSRPGLEHRIQLWPVAAYYRPTLLSFAARNNRADEGSFGFNQIDGLSTKERVVAVALDDYLPANADITLVKCDAQGADLQALMGLQQTIARCRPLIIFEWEEGLAQDQGSTWDDYWAFFHRIGYSVERITTDYWDYVARPT